MCWKFRAINQIFLIPLGPWNTNESLLYDQVQGPSVVRRGAPSVCSDARPFSVIWGAGKTPFATHHVIRSKSYIDLGWPMARRGPRSDHKRDPCLITEKGLAPDHREWPRV